MQMIHKMQLLRACLRLKKMSRMSNDKIDHLACKQVENSLRFAGFLVFHCALKEGTEEALKALADLPHKIRVTITVSPSYHPSGRAHAVTARQDHCNNYNRGRTVPSRNNDNDDRHGSRYIPHPTIRRLSASIVATRSMCIIFCSVTTTLSVSCSLQCIFVLAKEIYAALGMLRLVVGLLFFGYTAAMSLQWDGHVPFSPTDSNLNASSGRFLT